MQDANQAYKKHNLFELLEMSERLARDQGVYKVMSDDEVNIYIKALKKDLTTDLPSRRNLSPRLILREREAHIQSMHQEMSDLQSNVPACANLAHLKEWLKAMRYQQQEIDRRDVFKLFRAAVCDTAPSAGCPNRRMAPTALV